MEDHLKRRLEKVRTFSESAKRRANLYVKIAKIDNKNTSGALHGLHKASAPGKKLQKVGFILFWIPEPTCITMAIGAPMILAGRFIDKKYNGSTVKDIGVETMNNISSLSNFKNSLIK